MGEKTEKAINKKSHPEAAEQKTDPAPDDRAEPGAENQIEAPDKAETAPAEETETAHERIAALEAQLGELNDQYLRKAADFENFRKRMNREKQEAIDFANQNLILDLIPIIDDFERAINAAEIAIAGGDSDAGRVSKDFTALYEGITMTEKRLLAQLENRWGLKRYDAAGEAFDPNRHEALMMEKSPDVTEATVQEVWSKGYTLKDRVVRTAKVKVLMPDGGGGNSANQETAETPAGAEVPETK
ncbi:MAG: nucleotide exchange factor GrpE [Treponema sp.]|jgi:molecular chaperone GrpE|nr:nucleotide exchange factor GrpE [Treponema sp.]